MTPVDAIYQKYISVFYEIDAGGAWIDLAAVRYALRAALRELAAAQPAVDIIEEHRHLDGIVRRIERVLEAHDSAVYADLVAGNIELPTAIDAVIDSYKAALAAVAADTQRSNARLEQLNRINAWIISYAGDAYDLSCDDGDTADAIIAVADTLRGECERRKIAVGQLQSQNVRVTQEFQATQTTINQLRHDLATTIAERDAAYSRLAKLADCMIHDGEHGDGDEVDLAISLMTRQAAEIKRLNADLAILRSYAIATPHGNGKSSVAAAAAIQAADQPEQYPPAIVAAVEAAQAATVQIGDDPELSDYIIGLEAGRHTWRTIPKLVRWRLVQAHLRSIWRAGKLPSMADFDAHSPAWMPSATSVAMTFGDGKWSVACGKAVEP